jgi:mono/diheme cytochrome c family protein
MKNTVKITLFLALLIAVSSCSNKRHRKVQYMADTDMYTSVPYDTYSENPVFNNGITAQKPVDGTVPRGLTPYEYPNSEAGYNAAKDSLRAPFPADAKVMQRGEKLYTIYCAICHGKTGDGQGQLVKNEKFLGVPNYKDRVITEGSIYHVIMHGRNMMGSHSSQLNERERWEVVHYVQKLRADLIK